MNHDTFYFGPGIDSAMLALKNSTTETPFRDLLIQLWQNNWCGLDKVGLSVIKITPYQEPKEHALSFHFQEDAFAMRESEVRTIDNVLRLLANWCLSEKKRVEPVLRKIQELLTALDRTQHQALYQIVTREVEWRADLSPNSLAQATVITYGELLLLYAKGDKKCYVIDNATSILDVTSIVEKLRITTVPVDDALVPQAQPILDFLQNHSFEDLHQIRGMPVS